MHRLNALLMGLTLAAGATSAMGAATIEFFTPGYLITDTSYDGSVFVGNVQGDGSYETFRWTAEEGIVRLGRATVPVLGIGAGSPDVSYDGTRVSATILSSDNLQTQGVWDANSGWTETMPPMPANGVIADQSYGSAWGLSGDGTTLTGFYWIGGTGGAQVNTWTPTDGVVALPKTPGRSARGNGANYDGSVVVGWEDLNGPWQPTAWRNGQKMVLVESLARGEARATTADGDTIVGAAYNPAQARTSATIWRWNGAAYTTEFVGFLPGTAPNSGSCWLESISDDGRLAVGFNNFTFNPGGAVDGVVWTPETGLVNDATFLAGLGLGIPAGSEVRGMTAVSPDGNVIVGTLLLPDLRFQSFIIRLNNCPADVNGDGVVDFADLNELLGNYNMAGDGLPGDIDGDGVVGFADLNLLLSAYNTACD